MNKWLMFAIALVLFGLWLQILVMVILLIQMGAK